MAVKAVRILGKAFDVKDVEKGGAFGTLQRICRHV